MRLGPYELLERLGEGGMGVVHRARAPDGRIVAVKILKTDALARFERERRLLASLADAGFVPLLDAGAADGREYLVMPFLDGGSLRSRLATGPIRVESAVALGRDLARALGAAHAKGIVHRDVKPENLLFDGEGRVWIADLGLAKHFDREAPGASRSAALSRTGEFRGTLGYMAPEQMNDAKNVGPPADVFALGAVLYECLAGAPPFEAESGLDVIQKVLEGKFPPLSRRAKGVPSGVARTVERALAHAPEDRFADGEALRAALDAAPEASWRLSAIVVGALALALGAGLLWLSRGHGGVAPPPPSAAPAIVHVPGTPTWFDAVRPELRPALPLPDGLTFGPKDGEYLHARDGSVLVFVPGGSCRLGSDANPLARDAFTADVPPFWIGKFEVTNEQFARFVEATHHRTRAEKDGTSMHLTPQGASLARTPEAWHTQISFEFTTLPVTWRKPFPDGKDYDDKRPVVCVNWFDAEAYVEWAGLVLPSEDQWEKAASWDPVAKAQHRYPWGDDPGAGARANLRDASLYRAAGIDPSPIATDDGHPWAAPVGSFKDDRAPCGALDMAGNVTEWCGDTHPTPNKLKSAVFGVLEAQGGENRVVKGGNWTYAVEWVKLCDRTVLPGDNTHGTVTGFRVALVPRRQR